MYIFSFIYLLILASYLFFCVLFILWLVFSIMQMQAPLWKWLHRRNCAWLFSKRAVQESAQSVPQQVPDVTFAWEGHGDHTMIPTWEPRFHAQVQRPPGIIHTPNSHFYFRFPYETHFLYYSLWSERYSIFPCCMVVICWIHIHIHKHGRHHKSWKELENGEPQHLPRSLANVHPAKS